VAPEVACYHALPLDTIGRYRILEKIGQGATSNVYKGHDAALGRDLAIKVISSDVGADDVQRRRFQREAQAAARLVHPHIVKVFDFGQEQDKLYMAMELLEGTDLKQAVADHRLKTLDEKLDVLEQICDGLAFAHLNGIVHRDLKPANIHLLPDGQVKIMDFGLARMSGSDMTRTGLVMGTPHYMSPEQVRGEHVDSRSDVFSLGCVFYEILTERKPFDGESLHSVLYMVLQASPRPPREVVPDLPRVVQQLLDRSLAREPAARFPDAAAFLTGVQQVREAIAEGRGDEPLPALVVAAPVPAVPVPPVADTAPLPEPQGPRSASSSRNAERLGSGQRSGSRSASASGSRRRALRGRLPLVTFGIALATVAAGVVFLLARRGPDAPASRAASDGARQVDTLARAVVATQVELAQKRLAAGDFENAVRQAERALALDPQDATAKDVLAKATRARDEIDKLVSEARAAADGELTAASGDAFWRLLQAAPDNPATSELASRFDAVLKARAAEAQRLAVAARQAAESVQAGRADSFQEGMSLVRDGDAGLRAGKFGEAARDFMRARARFERAQRTGR
jgi:serine/threonine protein kinase